MPAGRPNSSALPPTWAGQVALRPCQRHRRLQQRLQQRLRLLCLKAGARTRPVFSVPLCTKVLLLPLPPLRWMSLCRPPPPLAVPRANLAAAAGCRPIPPFCQALAARRWPRAVGLQPNGGVLCAHRSPGCLLRLLGWAVGMCTLLLHLHYSAAGSQLSSAGTS